jgi:regulator of nonsense transcripts 2
VLTKDPLPMDVEFILQDSYALTRPHWKLSTDVSEAARLFGEAVAQNYKVQEIDKAPELDDEAESSPSDDGLEEDVVPDVDEERSSSEDEVKFLNACNFTMETALIQV